RLIQHLVVESGLLALTGGALGVAIATVGVKLLSTVGASSLPGIETIKIDGPVLLFALGLSITTGLLFGFAPALLVARRAVAEGVRQGARSTGDRGTHRMQRTLVAVEVALSVMLVAGAGLFAHSFVRLSSTNPGFRPDHVLTASVAMNDASYPDEAKMLRFTRTVLEEARAIPGVDAAALATHMPFSGQGWGNSYDVEGHPAKPGTSYVAQIRPVSPDFFRALGIAIRQGKPFTEADRAKAAGVAIVNETLARRFWPNEPAIGKRIRYGQDWLTIQGVVADIKHARLDQDTDPEIYIPYEQLPPGLMKFLGRSIYVIVHGSLDPASMGPALRRVIHAADPTIAVRGLTPLESMITESYAQSRFRTGLLVAFSVIALVLAGVGIYGVMSYLVAQRRQEIGVRLALGATRGGVVQMVVARALTVSTLGVLAGLVAAAALAGTVRGLLYGVADYDPLAFTFAAGALIAVAVAASLAPALRAARTDPLTSLRVE
ncbi:MAG: ABC transporter permease, partial [Acidobacteriaceae bacterium]|nr:ABC transporter permease [Acidobacteriaceae bacterium]